MTKLRLYILTKIHEQYTIEIFASKIMIENDSVDITITALEKVWTEYVKRKNIDNDYKDRQ